MRKLLLILMFVVFGCGATTSSEHRPIVAEDRRPEARDLPPDAVIEPLPAGVPTEPSENYVMPFESGFCISGDGTDRAEGPCPLISGIVVSEARAMRDATYRIRYPELRQLYQSDRQVWTAHRELYESQIVADREEIERLRPTWWERNDMAIGIAIGLVTGAAITVAITYAVNQVSE